MKKRVAADTITDITSAPDFAPSQAVPPPPTRDSLIEEIKEFLAQQALAAEEDLRRVQKKPQPKKEKAKQDRKDEIASLQKIFNRVAAKSLQFEEILQEMPEGFELAPVFYSKIASGKNADIQNEYIFRVRDQFLRFLAENHEEDLKKLGIADVGIARMRKGLDPVNERGMLYDISIDHIIERSGCGLWAEGKTVDPDRDAATPPKFRANHFSNMILLPEHIHEFKNTLNNAQGVSQFVPGEGKWILMLVPKRDAQYNGFVAPSQSPQHKLHGVNIRPHDITKKIGHANYVIARAHNWLDIINDQRTPDRQDKTENFLKPALEDVALQLQEAFDFVTDKSTSTSPDKKNADYKSFVRFYQGGGVRRLKERVRDLTFAQAAALQSVFAAIDEKIPPPKVKKIQKLLKRPPFGRG